MQYLGQNTRKDRGIPGILKENSRSGLDFNSIERTNIFNQNSENRIKNKEDMKLYSFAIFHEIFLKQSI